MIATGVLTSVGGPDSMTIVVTVQFVEGLTPPWDYVFYWTDAGGEIPTVITSSLDRISVRHTYPFPGVFDVLAGIVAHGADPFDVNSDFAVFEEIVAENVYAKPRLRIFPRDDAVGHTPRQGKTSRSVQGSARQGWSGTYR